MTLLLAERKPMRYFNEIAEFIQRDVCSFLMKRLSAHHAITYQHSIRVALHSMSMAERLGALDEAEADRFLRTVLLHDIGKLAVPSGILNHRGALGREEWTLLQSHSEQGSQMLSGLIGSGHVIPEVILYHHENLDGSGYPYGMQEKDLSMLVRIVRVADSFDAMTCQRGYNLVKSRDEALEELYRWNDVCYDARAVECLHQMMSGGDTHDTVR